VVAVALAVLALALPIEHQELGCAETSSFALVRALASGTPRIDENERETCDKARRGDHFYSSKAPGLAIMMLPAYGALHSTGLLPDNRRTTLWLLGLWSAILPAAVMLLLTRRLANRFEPGTGTLVAVVLALGAITLPLAALNFGHVLAAALLLASFAIAVEQRRPGGRLLALVGAGALAGFAITTEYPAGTVAVVIGIFAACAARPVQRLVAFGAGGLAGIAPLLFYNHWAFGSILTLSYTDAVSSETAEGAVTVGQHDQGFFGVLVPSLSSATRIMLGNRGLLALTPVMLAGVVGLVLLARRGFRAEAIAIGGVIGVMLLYNASLNINPGWVFGGDSPGPRYFYLAVPFAILPLGLVVTRAPALVAALVGISVARMVMATSTHPLIGHEGTGRWLSDLEHGSFADTPLTLLGFGHGWIAMTPFFLVVLAAVAAAALTAPVEWADFSWSLFATTFGAWGIVVLAGGAIIYHTGTTAALVAIAICVSACLLVVMALPPESRKTVTTPPT
jgi:hypothetical protein